MTKQDALSVTSNTLTAYNMQSGARNKIIRYGRMRTIIIDGKTDKAFNANTLYEIFTLPQSDRPYNFSTTFVAFSRYTYPGAIKFDSTGVVTLNSAQALTIGFDICINLTYIAQD